MTLIDVICVAAILAIIALLIILSDYMWPRY